VDDTTLVSCFTLSMVVIEVVVVVVEVVVKVVVVVVVFESVFEDEESSTKVTHIKEYHKKS